MLKVLPLVSFDAGAATALAQLQPQRLQLGKMDARIAAEVLVSMREMWVIFGQHPPDGSLG